MDIVPNCTNLFVSLTLFLESNVLGIFLELLKLGLLLHQIRRIFFILVEGGPLGHGANHKANVCQPSSSFQFV